MLSFFRFDQLEAMAEILTKKVHFLGDLKTPKLRLSNWPLVIAREPEFFIQTNCNILMWIVHNFLIQYSLFFAVSTILVSTGAPTGDPRSYATQTSEVINLEDNSVCQDVEDFPLAISQAVGAYLGSFPVICGGSDEKGSSLNQCHQLKSGIWQPFATLDQRYIY